MFEFDDFRLSGVTIRAMDFAGRSAIEVKMPASAVQDPAKEALRDRDFMAVADVDFGDGIIEVDVASKLEADAPAYARGFIGLAYRISAGRFESIYLRPTNSRVGDQVRRNRTIQYVAFPDYTFPRLREEEPGKYETYADIEMEKWIRMRLEVRGATTKLFLNDAEQPALVVTDMKHGPEERGGVGLWIESGTIGYFANLNVTAD